MRPSGRLTWKPAQRCDAGDPDHARAHRLVFHDRSIDAWRDTGGAGQDQNHVIAQQRIQACSNAPAGILGRGNLIRGDGPDEPQALLEHRA